MITVFKEYFCIYSPNMKFKLLKGRFFEKSLAKNFIIWIYCLNPLCITFLKIS